MKIKNIKDVDGFFKVIDSCAGKVELITGEVGVDIEQYGTRVRKVASRFIRSDEEPAMMSM